MSAPANIGSCKTLFIIGAGAGYDYGMPMGEGLIAGISVAIRKLELFERSLDAPTHLDWALFQAAGKSEKRARAAVARIERGLVFAKSIDTLLTDTADEDVSAVGKVLIAHVLGERESKATYFTSQGRVADAISPMTTNGGIKEERRTIRDTWMPAFFRELRAGLTPTQFANRLSTTAIITFNYDRLLEHFLDVAIGQYDGLSPDKAIALRQTLRIIHPYGIIAPLNVPICSRLDGHIEEAPENIRTYDEAIDKDADAHIKGLVSTAKRTIFLGFGFHAQNMRLLGYPRTMNVEQMPDFFATARGFLTNESSG